MNSVNFANSEHLRNHSNIIWVQIKYPFCYLCPPETVVACYVLTEEIAGSNTPFSQKYSTNSVDSLEFI